ncbi:MAG: hypothetical protein GC165_12485 [Armatimonadetes bacterium]|nr:hypothetical protein [Armatimonadota bacterium]
MSGPIRINVLGDFSVFRADGDPARFRTNRASEVIALLVLRESRRMLREELAFDIWPDADRSSRLANLRPALSYARQAIGDANILLQEGEMISLSSDAKSDWEDIDMLEGRAQSAEGRDHQLIALYALNDALRDPLLRGWNSEWIDRYRDYHGRRQTAALRQLAETCATLGDWTSALEHAQRLSEADPYDEDGVRLKLQAFGALGRLSEAQIEYARYSKRMISELGLKPSPGLRQLADTVVSGRYQARGTKATTAQKDLVWQILDMLVEEDAERVLPLLSTSKLNWSIATSGPDLRTLIERVMRETNGWSPDRRGVAKRLLQIYAQDLECQLSIDLARDLLDHSEPSDRIPALNFLAIAEQMQGNADLAESHLQEAISAADEGKQPYFGAVSKANLAVLHMRQLKLDKADAEMTEALTGLTEASEPNALLSLGFAKSNHALIAWMTGDHRRAKELIDDWSQFCGANGMISFDSMGKGIFALISASSDIRQARAALLSAVHGAMAERNLATQLGILPVLVAAIRIAFSSDEADRLATMTEAIYRSRQYTILPATRRLLGTTQSSGNETLSPFDVYVRIRTLVLR